MTFAPEDLLWVKLEGYPWWPAKALGDEYLASNPNPSDDPNTMAILFFGTDDMGFIDRSNPEVVVPFDSSDHEKCIECSTDPTLSAALETALETIRGGGNQHEKEADSASSSDDEEAAGYGDDLLLGIEGGETEEERKARRKKEKKEKKDKKKGKKDKKDKKKDKKDKKRRDEGADHHNEGGEGEEGVSRRRSKHDKNAASSPSGRENKRSRTEKTGGRNKSSKHISEGDSDGGHDYGRSNRDDEDDGYNEHQPITFEKVDISDEDLLLIKTKIDDAIANRDVDEIRDCFSYLSNVNVKFEQLVVTGIGQSVGLVCDVGVNKEGWDARFAPLQVWAETIIRYWFSKIPDRHKGQLIDAGEVDRASLASNEDAASRHSEDEFNTLNTFGLAIERAFEDAPESSSGLADRTETGADELLSRTVASYGNLAASSFIMSAAEISLEIQRAVEALDANHRSQRGAEVLEMLQRANHTELREALLRGLLSAKDFVLNPLHSSLTSDEKRELEEAEDEAGKAMDITGEKERIEKAIADAEVVEK